MLRRALVLLGVLEDALGLQPSPGLLEGPCLDAARVSAGEACMALAYRMRATCLRLPTHLVSGL